MKLYRWTKCRQKVQTRMLKSILNHFKVNVFDQVKALSAKLVQIKYVGKRENMSEMFELGIWGWSWYQVQPSNNKNSDNYLKDWVGNKHGISNCIWEGWRELTLISCCIFVVGILKHLTDVLELRDFLQILPDEGNMLFFLPYITECQEKEKSKQLLNIIRKKGEHLQHYIWYLLICVVKVHVLDLKKKPWATNYRICITILLFYLFPTFYF